MRKTSTKTRTRKPSTRTRKPKRLSAPLPPNAAELWAAQLPTSAELAILAERTARTEREYVPAPLPHIELDTPELWVTSSRKQAMATVALMALLVALCAWGCGLVHLH